MARLDNMPSMAIVAGFKGKIDFYQWKGVTCVRKWPDWPPRKPSPAEAVSQARFSYVMGISKQLPPYIIQQYKDMAAGTPYRWQDLLVRSYLTGMNYG